MNGGTLLPEWAEDVLRRFGPQPAWSSAAANHGALKKYAAMTQRFRRRWAELDDDVWRLFVPGHIAQAQHLLGSMLDLARYGSRVELAARRDALKDVARLEDELREVVNLLLRKLNARAGVTHENGIEGGLDDELLLALKRAATDIAMQSWHEPRLDNSDFAEAISSRGTARDALNMMLLSLQHIGPLLHPVQLTDKARAAIFNVAHDTGDAEHYSAEAVKKARADLRKR